MKDNTIAWVSTDAPVNTMPGQISIGTLDKTFLTNVLKNLPKEAVVAFGQKGTGQIPNYVVTLGSERTAYLGSNHKPDKKNEKGYSDDNLSEPFSHQEILETFCKVRDRKI